MRERARSDILPLCIKAFPLSYCFFFYLNSTGNSAANTDVFCRSYNEIRSTNIKEETNTILYE